MTLQQFLDRYYDYGCREQLAYGKANLFCYFLFSLKVVL